MINKLRKIVEELIKRQIKIAFAESCTGGFISHMFTNIPGVSAILDRGIVCYSNQSKIDLLNVRPDDIEKEGAVSEIVARQLAFNLRALSNVDIAIGITGIAGPSGGTKEKPVGLVFIGFCTKDETRVKKYEFETSRIIFKQKVLEKVLDYLEKI